MSERKQPLHVLFAGSDRNMKIGMVCAILVVLIGVIGALTTGGDGSSPDQALIEAVDSDSSEDSSDSADSAAATDSASTDAGSTDAESTEDAAAPAANRFSDLATIDPASLPGEALDTLALIASGGPYPFSRDDLIFQNREGILPDRPQGHYREYTVITPGEDDRGARRIVAGDDGELYYTSDHYSSFSEIVSGS